VFTKSPFVFKGILLTPISANLLLKRSTLSMLIMIYVRVQISLINHFQKFHVESTRIATLSATTLKHNHQSSILYFEVNILNFFKLLLMKICSPSSSSSYFSRCKSMAL
jgi:hypothetical protein